MTDRRTLLKTLALGACSLPTASFLTSCGSTGTSSYSGGGGGVYSGGLVLGIDRLIGDGFPILRGKRVGLICNQTSASASGTHTRRVLQRALGKQLTALYAPEHGVDGTIAAGRYVPSITDSVTGLPVYSLHGDTRKPAPSMLRDIDVLLFDLQDIGCRSYTYISCMTLAMEACGENGKEFVVLDRPNPLGGHRVEGPPLERAWKSYVGQIPVPYVHGMTAGELAQMLNANGWNNRRCRLTVVPMLGWNRSNAWDRTGLRWIPTSPNIPHRFSPAYYVTTGMLGGMTGVDIGIGTGGPFEYAGGYQINGSDLANSLRSYGWSGVSFSPYTSSRKAGYSGVRISLNPYSQSNLVSLGITLIHEINRRTSPNLFQKTKGDTWNLFCKVYGSANLGPQLASKGPRGVAASWESFCQSFRSRRQPYLLYA